MLVKDVEPQLIRPPILVGGASGGVEVVSCSDGQGAPLVAIGADERFAAVAESEARRREVERRRISIFFAGDKLARVGKFDIGIELLNTKRLLTTPEVAAMVSLLCSEEGRGINGQALVMDGGGLLA